MDLKTLSTFLALVVPFFLATVWALVDSVQKEFESPGRKVFWIVVAGIPFVGFIVYLLFGYRRGRKPD